MATESEGDTVSPRNGPIREAARAALNRPELTPRPVRKFALRRVMQVGNIAVRTDLSEPAADALGQVLLAPMEAGTDAAARATVNGLIRAARGKKPFDPEMANEDVNEKITIEQLL